MQTFNRIIFIVATLSLLFMPADLLDKLMAFGMLWMLFRHFAQEEADSRELEQLRKEKREREAVNQP